MSEKDKKYNKDRNIFEYEDYGEPTMYLFAILSIIVSLGLAILFAMFVAGVVITIGGLAE